LISARKVHPFIAIQLAYNSSVKSFGCKPRFMAPATEEAVMLKPLLIVSAVVLFGIAASASLSPMAQDAAPASAPGMKNPVKPTEKSQARAKELYGQECSICHGDNGDGKTDLAKDMGVMPGDWTDPKTLAGKQDGELFNSIRNGKGKMPPEAEGRAKNDEVWNLILYIRGLAKQQPVAAAPVSN
jgi:mono/diheme cytochrome c family protein